MREEDCEREQEEEGVEQHTVRYHHYSRVVMLSKKLRFSQNNLKVIQPPGLIDYSRSETSSIEKKVGKLNIEVNKLN